MNDLNDTQQAAVRILHWMVNEAVMEVQAAGGVTGLDPDGRSNPNDSFQQALDRAFLRAMDNPFKSRAELSAAHTEAVRAAGEVMQARVARMLEEERAKEEPDQ